MSILIIYTGGTIGMVKGADGALRPSDGINLKTIVRKELGNHFDFISFPIPMDSSDLGVNEINRISRLVKEHYEKYTAFLILTGTDTMAYLAAVLTYVLENLNKPVLLTGSQNPVGIENSDGEKNLKGALDVLTNKKSRNNRVSIYFYGQLLSGDTTIKFSSYHDDGFKSFHPTGTNKSSINEAFGIQELKEKNILVLTLHPYMEVTAFEKHISNKNYDAIILNTYGAGNIKMELKTCLLNTKNDKTKIIIRSQCIQGGTSLGKYASGISCFKNNILDAKDLTLESALAKTIYLLNKGLNPNDFKKKYTE